MQCLLQTQLLDMSVLKSQIIALDREIDRLDDQGQDVSQKVEQRVQLVAELGFDPAAI